jgi:hypothetical protein
MILVFWEMRDAHAADIRPWGYLCFIIRGFDAPLDNSTLRLIIECFDVSRFNASMVHDSRLQCLITARSDALPASKGKEETAGRLGDSPAFSIPTPSNSSNRPRHLVSRPPMAVLPCPSGFTACLGMSQRVVTAGHNILNIRDKSRR